MSTTPTATLNVKGLLTALFGVIQPLLAFLEKLSGPEIEAFKDSLQKTIDAGVAAMPAMTVGLFNLGVESIPVVKVFAPEIEAIADPLVSAAAGNAVNTVKDDVAALNLAGVNGVPLKPAGT